MGMIRLPKVDFIVIDSSGEVLEVTVTLLSIEPSMAFTPYTTKCSPKRMTFPGAEAMDFK